ncbi:nucleoid-associated protein YejK [Alteromonas sediminis]|uniref:Nucleoid-associated protein YejK n=1 Tax=Alteromonas sediminis TaxID=2259342 RepID=A0A3N5YDD0_9ALTE|nr:nucleoid-associated protein YejK [Alteromonas sediminis]RPJ67545.1 nucleoid-associated protein YejK [Alteromonas sediminis]
MSMQVHHFVVHQIGMDNNEKLTLVPREACLSPSLALDAFCHQLNHSFNSKPGKGVGCFSDDNQAFAQSLRQFMRAQSEETESDAAFHGFSVEAGTLLIKALLDTNTVETGFLVFAHYEYLATQYLMIGLLNTREHIEVNSALELSSKEHLDLARMQLAVKLDLTQLSIQPEQNRYISFIKGRMGRKVSDFFMQFVGCEEQVDVKQQNKLLISSVDEYLSTEVLDASEKHQHRDQVKDYMKSKHVEGEEISIKELSAHLPSDLANKSDFSVFVENLETPIEPSFAPDPSALRQLAKFSGQGGGVSVAFDRKLMGERVHYDVNTDTLTIKGVPPNLKDQLTKALKSHNEG